MVLFLFGAMVVSLGLFMTRLGYGGGAMESWVRILHSTHTFKISLSLWTVYGSKDGSQAEHHKELKGKDEEDKQDLDVVRHSATTSPPAIKTCKGRHFISAADLTKAMDSPEPRLSLSYLL